MYNSLLQERGVGDMPCRQGNNTTDLFCTTMGSDLHTWMLCPSPLV